MSARVPAAAGGLATIAFLVAGMAFDGWSWAWVFFLVPGVLRTLLRGERREGG